MVQATWTLLMGSSHTGEDIASARKMLHECMMSFIEYSKGKFDERKEASIGEAINKDIDVLEHLMRLDQQLNGLVLAIRARPAGHPVSHPSTWPNVNSRSPYVKRVDRQKENGSYDHPIPWVLLFYLLSRTEPRWPIHVHRASWTS